MKRLGLVLALLTAVEAQVWSQIDTKGVHFVCNLRWKQVLQKARAENRYIFVDCYASWCGPCKWMDQHVYADDTVGDFMNKVVIAIKMQMDTTQHDVARVRDWYSTAHDFGKQYLIRTYPTYLFFSPDGRLVHKAIGRESIGDFVALVRAAMNPRQQYYTLLTQFQQGTLQYNLFPYLANTARKLQDDSLSSTIAAIYLHYLGEQPDSNLWTKDNIKFIGSYAKAIHYKDRVFERYFYGRMKIDSTMGSVGYANRLVNQVAYNDVVSWRIDAGIKDGSEPKWHAMERTIKRKYGAAFVRENLLEGREAYYHAVKKWKKYTKYFILERKNARIEDLTPGPIASIVLNNCAFEIFKYSKRKRELSEALFWIDRALSMKAFEGQELDTKANLLYKLGRRSEAISFERQSLFLAPGDKDIQGNYEKMKNGQPTW